MRLNKDFTTKENALTMVLFIITLLFCIINWIQLINILIYTKNLYISISYAIIIISIHIGLKKISNHMERFTNK